jgi:hypothetical protein
MKPVHKKIAIARQKLYGDPKISHDAIGAAWRAILQNRYQDVVIPPIPAELVALMFAAFKLVRAARPLYHQDNYDDAQIYTQFAEHFKAGKVLPV